MLFPDLDFPDSVLPDSVLPDSILFDSELLNSGLPDIMYRNYPSLHFFAEKDKWRNNFSVFLLLLFIMIKLLLSTFFSRPFKNFVDEKKTFQFLIKASMDKSLFSFNWLEYYFSWATFSFGGNFSNETMLISLSKYLFF